MIADAIPGGQLDVPTDDPRPPRTIVTTDTILEKLRDTDQWVMWLYERDEKDTKWTKVPYRVVPGQQYGASSIDSTTWTTFLDA